MQGHRSEENVIIEGTHLLAATGRIPNTDDIGLDVTGVEVNERGYILVNEHLQTTAEDV
ncbi:FAD-dependent oxidoreductase [Aliifodinibius sp. S!AR15-10]|nr:FAD-dependent oxidoreductase [Aliifodinibius sp. S!AR15-10]